MKAVGKQSTSSGLCFLLYSCAAQGDCFLKYPLARLEAIAASWTKEVVWEGLGTANFTLFKTIRMYIRYWGKLNSFENLFGNVLAFCAAWLLIAVSAKESRRFWILFLDAFVLVCCIELFQLFTAFGAFDVDDILLNCVGALLGYAFFSRCLRDAVGHRRSRMHRVHRAPLDKTRYLGWKHRARCAECGWYS